MSQILGKQGKVGSLQGRAKLKRFMCFLYLVGYNVQGEYLPKNKAVRGTDTYCTVERGQ